MNNAPHDAKLIFLEAVEHVSPAQWPEFLDQTCRGEPELRAQVQRLLNAHVAGDRFMASPATLRDPSMAPDKSLIAERPGTQIGPYTLVEQLGEGGMGVVFLAEQREPARREVALKIVKPGMDTKEVIARFETERQALAMMNHVNIAKVLSAGTTESGRPYFVMELVCGDPITQYADQNQLTVRQRLGLFRVVCEAVQHAHQKGIIHRDIKPSNVMISLAGNVPTPKMIDFGIAKAITGELTSAAVTTTAGQIVGTPAST